MTQIHGRKKKKNHTPAESRKHNHFALARTAKTTSTLEEHQQSFYSVLRNADEIRAGSVRPNK